MSLGNIFDPVVRAYFAGQCSGGDSGSANGIKVAEYRVGGTYETFTTSMGEDEQILAKIYDGLPTKDELIGGTLAFCYGEELALTTYEWCRPLTNSLIDVDEFGGLMIGNMVVSINEEMAQMIGCPSTGLWLPLLGDSHGTVMALTLVWGV